MTIPENRLLLLSCSEQKAFISDLMPALMRYAGPAFRVVRKYKKEFPEESQKLAVYILSAKYGLITAETPIPIYDYRMTSKRARELHFDTVTQLCQIVAMGGYRELFINLGQNYLQAISGFTDIKPLALKVIFAQGSQGGRLASLKQWLQNGRLPDSNNQSEKRQNHKVTLRGVEIEISPEQIIGIARGTLNSVRDTSTQYQAWYVQIDDQRVGVKWLVSQITGLPVSSFHSEEARRVLTQLGIQVRQL